MVMSKDVHFCSQFSKTARRTPNETCRWANVLKMSNIEHSPAVERCIMWWKTKELTLKQILSVPCPTCGAAIEEACELHTGPGAPSHTEIGNFPQPRPWNEARANDKRNYAFDRLPNNCSLLTSFLPGLSPIISTYLTSLASLGGSHGKLR
jgi:hypothetical protein